MEIKKGAAPAYLRRLFDKYKYVLLLAAVGAALLLFPAGGGSSAAAPAKDTAADGTAALQAQLETLLADIAGVGRVRVLLAAQTSGETVYAYDENKTASKSDGAASSGSTLTLVTGGSGGQPVVVRTEAPEFSGAVVVCEGADSARVRLALTEAVGSLTGISADHIVIVKMK